MSLPAWVGVRPARHESIPISHQYEVADSPHTAPGYRIIGDALYTCVTPVGYTVDPGVMKWMRTLDPTLVPIWRKQTYMYPKSMKTFVAVHLGMAKFVKNPRGPLRLAYVEMPAGAKFPMPNLIAMPIFEDTDHNIVMHEGGPAPYQPLDMRKYTLLRDAWNGSKTVEEQLEEHFRRQDEAQRRENARVAAEWLYVRADLDKFHQKQLNAPGDTLVAYRQWRAKRTALAIEYLRRMNLKLAPGVK